MFVIPDANFTNKSFVQGIQNPSNPNEFQLKMVPSLNPNPGQNIIQNWTYDLSKKMICGTGNNSNICFYSPSLTPRPSDVIGVRLGGTYPSSDPGFIWESGPIYAPPNCGR